MKTISTTLTFLFFISFVIGQERKIEVDFAKPAYYPLLKSKGSVFQEGFPYNPNVSASMKPLSELGIGVFRILGFMQGREQIWKEGNRIRVTRPSDFNDFFESALKNQIQPCISLYQTPLDFRPAGAKFNATPSNMEEYGAAIEMFVKQYVDTKPIMWEVWNEAQSKQFLHSDNVVEDYNHMYQVVAPKIRAADPDATIVGPAMANNSDREGFTDAFINNVLSNSLPIDYYSIHSYNRFGTNGIDRLDDLIGLVRKRMKDNFQTVPLVFTEYEHFPSGANIANKQAPREWTLGAVRWLKDLSYFIEQTDIPFVTWNRWQHNHRPGGLVDAELNRRPIYWAYKLYGDMPTERKELLITSNFEDIDGFASANETNAGIMLWNDSEVEQHIHLSISNLPFRKGSMVLYQIDADNSSYLENSDNDKLITKWEKDLANSEDIKLDIPGPGIVYVQFEKDVSQKGAKYIEPDAKFIRNWQWCARQKSGDETIVTGDYGNFDWQNWTANIGVKGAEGRGISGVTIDDTPSQMECTYKTFQVDENSTGANALVGLRIDYCVDGEYNNSVLLHGNLFNENRTSELPWAAKSAIANQSIKCDKIGSGEKFTIDFDKYAPEAWMRSGKRRAIISFWMENSGLQSQATVKLFGVDL